MHANRKSYIETLLLWKAVGVEGEGWERWRKAELKKKKIKHLSVIWYIEHIMRLYPACMHFCLASK